MKSLYKIGNIFSKIKTFRLLLHSIANLLYNPYFYILKEPKRFNPNKLPKVITEKPERKNEFQFY